MINNIAITIGRQYGSAGHEIGVRLGELLGFKVYDRELITLSAERKGLHPEYLRRVDEKTTHSLLYTLAMSTSLYRTHHSGVEFSINDQLFVAQTEIVKEAVEKEPCIFIGRCADYILRKHPAHLSFFIYAGFEERVAHVMEIQSCTRKQAEDLINKTDKQRVNYYNYYSGRKWGKFENYHYMIDSSVLGVEGTAQLMAQIVRTFEAAQNKQ